MVIKDVVQPRPDVLAGNFQGDLRAYRVGREADASKLENDPDLFFRGNVSFWVPEALCPVGASEADRRARSGGFSAYRKDGKRQDACFDHALQPLCLS